jgi:sugar/nucleoside kinase (ribokinase family)
VRVIRLAVAARGAQLTRGLLQTADKPLLEQIKSADELKQAVRFAAACGALTTLDAGAIRSQPSLKEIEDMVNSQQR